MFSCQRVEARSERVLLSYFPFTISPIIFNPQMLFQLKISAYLATLFLEDSFLK
jgi:hypothetical protein